VSFRLLDATITNQPSPHSHITTVLHVDKEMDNQSKRKHQYTADGTDGGNKDQMNPPNGTRTAASGPKRRKVNQHQQATSSPIRKPPPLGSIGKKVSARTARAALLRVQRPKSTQQLADAVLAAGKEDPVYQPGGLWPFVTPAAAEAAGAPLCPISNPPGLGGMGPAAALPRRVRGNPSDGVTSVGKGDVTPHPRRLSADIGKRLASSDTLASEAPGKSARTTALDRLSQQIEEIKTCLANGYHPAFLDFSKGTHNPCRHFWKRTEQNRYKFSAVLVAFFVCKKQLAKKKTIRYSALIDIIVGHAFGKDISGVEDRGEDTTREDKVNGDMPGGAAEDVESLDKEEVDQEGNNLNVMNGEGQSLLGRIAGLGKPQSSKKPKSFTLDQKKAIASQAILHAALILNVPREALGVR
jgi:hypothetical protein